MKIIADNTVPYLKGIAEPIAEVKYLNSKEFTPGNIHDADALIVRFRSYRYKILRRSRYHMEKCTGLQCGIGCPIRIGIANHGSTP